MSGYSDTLWLFAFLGSKCNYLSSFQNIILALFTIVLIYIILSLIYWAHPGGPAWGRHRFSSTVGGSSYKSAAPAIPGPRGLPILGSIHLMLGLAHHKLATTARRLAATRLMAFSLGSKTLVVVTSHPDVAKEILQSPAFADRPINESAYGLMFDRAIGFAPDGSYWRALRKVASTHMFSPKMIKGSEGQRREIASQMVEEVLKREGNRTTRTSFMVRDVLKKAALGNMMGSVFGWKLGGNNVNNVADEEELREMVDEGYQLLGGVNFGDHFSWLAQCDIQGIRFRCNRLIPRVNRFVGRIIEEHKAKLSKEYLVFEDGAFVDSLLSLQGTLKLSDQDLIAILWEMVFRGTDTVAVLIEWILARMVLHTQIQSKIHNELDNVVGRSNDISESHLPSLVYLTATIKEALRLHLPGPLLSWARRSITDTSVDGHHVPAGTTAMVNMWAITHDPEVWPNPLEFEPERFLPVPGKSANNDSGVELEFSVMGSDLRLAPFGSGRRSCPGKALGMVAVTYWVAALLHDFEWMAADGVKVDLSETLQLSSEMANPLHVKVSARRRSSAVVTSDAPYGI